MSITNRFFFFILLAQMVVPGVAAITTATAAGINDRGTSQIVYRVSADGSGDYPTIEAALAAASDPNVDKVIQLAAGTYNYPLSVNTRLQLKVPRTHLKGAGPKTTKIVASSGKGLNSWGVLEVRATNCSVDGIWVENRWKKGDIPNKQTALAVGTAEDPKLEPDGLVEMSGIRISNSKFTATTKDRHSDNLAWDVVTVGANVTDCVFDRCEMRGFADVFSSWGQNVYVKNCAIIAKGWNAIWVSCGSAALGYEQTGISRFSHCKLGSSHYYIAGGATKNHPCIPVVYLDDCVPVNPDGTIPEAARMIGSTALKVVIGGTPFVPFEAVPGGPDGVPATVVTSDDLLGKKLMLGGQNSAAISGIMRFSHVVNKLELSAGQTFAQTFSCAGVMPGDIVTVSPGSDPEATGLVLWSGFVSAPGKVEVRIQAGPEGAYGNAGVPVNIMVTQF